MGAAELQGAEPLTAQHHLPDVDARGDRLVRRTGRAVVDDHDATAGQRRREGDPPRERRDHGLADRPREVDASMSGPEGGVGRVERAHDLRLRLERPHPHGNRVHGGTERTGRTREGEKRGHQHGDDDARGRPVDPDRGGEWDPHAHHGARAGQAWAARGSVTVDGGVATAGCGRRAGSRPAFR